MATRGRGRGRGGHRLHKVGETQPSERKPKPVRSLSELSEYLHTLNEPNFPNYGQMFSDMTLEFASSSPENMNSTVDLIFSTTIESRDHATLGARVCQKIVMHVPTDTESKKAQRTLFRQTLLGRFQSEYSKKDSTRKVSIESWLAIFSFLCEIFNYVRVNDNPLSVIGKAILSTMEWLLNLADVIDDEIECVCDNLKSIGATLETVSAEKTSLVFSALRTKIISRTTTCRIRCISLEVVEYRAMGWQDKKNELESYYMDAIADAAAEDEDDLS